MYVTGRSIDAGAVRNDGPGAERPPAASEPHPVRLHRYFESTCDLTPDATALVCGSIELTYRELDAEANRLAHYLRRQGIGRRSRVGILVDRSVRMYAALLGVLKAGAAYVPLDPVFPADRNAFIATDAALSAIVTTSSFGHKNLVGVACPLIHLDRVAEEVAACQADRLESDEGATGGVATERGAADDICYIVYTSGTTGRPKGVAVSQESICNFISVVCPVYCYLPTDRVYQGMTLSFDFSIEEIWPTLAAGATIVAGPTDDKRLGPGLAKFLADHRVTVLCCVPTLLGTMEPDVATLRLIVVGGEACPQDLVSCWSRPGRRMLNTYGPTETTVTATWTELVPDRRVTIGRPLPTYDVLLIDPETMRPLEAGEAGEILIGGPGVAIGYVNRLELTSEKFIEGPFGGAGDASREHTLARGEESSRHDVPASSRSRLGRGPARGRFFRTGDLGRLTAEGDIEFLGRIDTQVKIRGYRVELGEVEAVLRESPDVETAVVAVWPPGGDVQDLVAYVKPRVAGRPLPVQELHQRLRQRLPAYMVPAYIEPMDGMLVQPSGKVDRVALPAPTTQRLGVLDRPCVPPATPLEEAIAGVWADAFKLPCVSVLDDFFLDLGGHSLFAAQTISALRRQAGMTELGLGDLYAHPTVRMLAEYVSQNLSAAPAVETSSAAPGTAAAGPGGGAERCGGGARAAPAARPGLVIYDLARSRSRRLAAWPCGMAQAGLLYIMMAVFGAPLVASLIFATSDWAAGNFMWCVVDALAGSLLLTLLTLVLPIAVKWLVIGRARPGSYPLWGWYFFRWWVVRKVLATAPVRFMAGTPLAAPYLRALGARIGRNCHIGTGLIYIPDMLEVGDGASIGYGTHVFGYRVEGGRLHLGRVRIGAGCYVGNNSVRMPGSAMEDGARLGDQSLLAEGQRVPAGACWSGSPAGPDRQTDASVAELASHPAPAPGAGKRTLWAAAFVVAAVILSLVPAVAAVPGIVMLLLAGRVLGPAWAWAGAGPAGLVFVLSLCGLIAGLKLVVLPSVKAGVYPIYSAFYVRKWAVDVLMEMGITMMQALYATLYLPPWLRLLGASVGRRTEISTASHITPNLLHIDDESFVADAASAGPARVFRGNMVLAPTRIGRRSFLGNSAFLPAGSTLADNCLIGVLSVPPAGSVPPGTSWLGSPAMFLPRRQPSGDFSEQETFSPTPALVAQRLWYEFFRIVGPPAAWFLSGTLVAISVMWAMDGGGWPAAALTFPVFAVMAAVLASAVVLAVKEVLIGTYKPQVRPLWCRFVRRTELVTGLYENITTPMLLNLLAGTPLMGPVLRAYGARIGRRVFMETTYLTEFDLVTVGDEAEIGPFASLQTHLFEDRVMKMSRLTVGDRCSIGPRGVVLYDSVMEEGASLDALSLLMKGETLAAGTRWWGSPSRPSRTTHKGSEKC
jgi:non-ribosomal peptide synthetase-like protein